MPSIFDMPEEKRVKTRLDSFLALIARSEYAKDLKPRSRIENALALLGNSEKAKEMTPKTNVEYWLNRIGERLHDEPGLRTLNINVANGNTNPIYIYNSLFGAYIEEDNEIEIQAGSATIMIPANSSRVISVPFFKDDQTNPWNYGSGYIDDEKRITCALMIKLKNGSDRTINATCRGMSLGPIAHYEKVVQWSDGGDKNAIVFFDTIYTQIGDTHLTISSIGGNI